MIGYGGGTVCKGNVEQLRRWGWGMVITPFNPRPPVLRYMFDNGAWTDFIHKREFGAERFWNHLNQRILKNEVQPDFAVCPDLVAQGLKSLEFSLSWRRDLPDSVRWYLAVQDGMEPAHVAPWLEDFAGLFVGGTSEWKMRSTPGWAKLAREAGRKLHVGRVNTIPRAFYVAEVCGADSFDGTNWQRSWAGPQIERVVQGGQRALPLYR